MKKIILSLTLLITFGLSYGINPNEVKNNDDYSLSEELIMTPDYSSEINLLETTTTNVYPNICVSIGAAVFAASQEAGDSLNTSLTNAYNAMEACDKLIKVAILMNL
tara:strand:+ start:57352 stop:57672 length:321 start_codon:yes stop_codon:yes gene_type:complete